MASSCLVTGGAGFIGSALVRALVARGDRVRVLDSFFSGTRENLAEVAADVDIQEGDLRDDAALARALVDVELVFHQAAVASVPMSLANPVLCHDVNATGTLKLLVAARRAGVRRVVYAASSSAYGNEPTQPKRETMRPEPSSPYAISKLAGEYYCQGFAALYGVETVCLRYFNVFGPRQDPASEYAAVVPRFIVAALAGRAVTIFGDGTQSRDFCFVDNVVEANLLAAAADAGVSGRVINIASGSSITLNDLTRVLGEARGAPLTVAHAEPRAGDVKHSSADITAARTHLGYVGRVSFNDGLSRTMAWFASRSVAK